MNSILVLPGQLRAEMEILARWDYPRESCGLLLGQNRKHEEHIALYQYPGRNLAGDNHHYEIAPEDYLAAEIAAKTAGLRIIGVWHSHPNHPAQPSAIDRALAWQGWSYLIIAVHGAEIAELRSWRLDGEDFFEEAICHA